MTFKLGPTSLLRLQGIHPDLVKVVARAIQLTEIDFTVLEGLRNKERQAELLKAGATTTMNSRHLTGHAVDLGALVGGQIVMKAIWRRNLRKLKKLVEAA
jgi:peptidoglycan L-alanyl-D-glutamate endopeptidase CwlK